MFGNWEVKSYTRMAPGRREDYAVFSGIKGFFFFKNNYLWRYNNCNEHNNQSECVHHNI